MKILAVDAVGLFGILVLLAWWVARSKRDALAVAAALWAALGTLLAVAISQPINHAAARPRPFVSIPHVEVLVTRTHDFSFPSDHAVTAGAAAAGLWIVFTVIRRVADREGVDISMAGVLAWVGSALAMLVAFARVYVGAHYPGDVAGGLVLGCLVTFVGWLVVKRPLVALVEAIGSKGRLAILVRSSTPAGDVPGR